MKRFLSFVLLLAMIAVLVACSPISSGVVTSKDYDPAWTQTVYDQRCISRNAKGVCSGYISSPRFVYHPERFTLNLRGEEDKTGWVNVPEGEYNSYEVGDQYPRVSEKSDDGF
ncbi:hypothetical protein SEA_PAULODIABOLI_342 [Microbacterium phage PauloDiaboli]|nr:hypothetical protein SEA_PAULODIABOLI_342 [Microbacterium phage PauloDiaboli]